MKKLISAIPFPAAMLGAPASAQDVAAMNDLEFTYIAYTADNIDIRYAHLALTLPTNPEIHEFANTMIRDWTAVNKARLGLLDKPGVTGQDHPVSKALKRLLMIFRSFGVRNSVWLIR